MPLCVYILGCPLFPEVIRTTNPQSISLGQYYYVPMKIAPLATCLTLPVLEKSFFLKHCE